MPVITISRQFAAAGQVVGRLLAERFGAELLDREIVAAVAERAGIPEAEAEGYDERLPGLWQRIATALAAGSPDPAIPPLPADMLPATAVHERLARLTRTVIEEAAARGDAVIVGRGGAFILGRRPDTIHVQLHAPIDARLRFLGSYHARGVDLPVPVAIDLVQLWDRPPTSDSKSGRRWLSLARAILAGRARRPEDAAGHLATAARVVDDDRAGAIEVALGQAHLASRAAPGEVPAALAPVEGWLAELTGDDAACLRARWVGQVAHAYNHAGRIDDALALLAALPDDAATPAFARSRRANGLAYGLHRQGDRAAALIEARRAATAAGDAGHVRLRAMALLMVARIAGRDAEGRDAHARAVAIAAALADDTLAHRCRVAARDVDGA